MKLEETRRRTKRLALCSVFCALGVAVLYLGAIVDVLDISMSVLASLLTVMTVIEMGGFWPWLVYGVTGCLSLLLLPSKLPALFYVFFTGFYPMVKEKIEGKILFRPVRMIVKILLFSMCLALLWGICRLFLPEVTFDMWPGLTVGILEGTFVLYDFALSRMITAYLFSWRNKLKIKKL